MSNDNTVTLCGNVTRDPELRFTPTGVAVANLGIAINTKRKEGDQWVDGDPQYYDVTVWRELAENVAASVTKGMRIIVFGRLDFRTWETDDGQTRTKVEIVAESIGPDLRWAAASVQRVEKGASGGDRPFGREPAAAAMGVDEEPF